LDMLVRPFRNHFIKMILHDTEARWQSRRTDVITPLPVGFCLRPVGAVFPARIRQAITSDYERGNPCSECRSNRASRNTLSELELGVTSGGKYHETGA
jgi:hypothetical protein